MLYQLVMIGSLFSQQVTNVYHYESDSGVASFSTILDTLGADFKGAIQALVTTDITFTHVHARRLDVLSAGFDAIPSTWPFAGTNVGSPAPPFVCASIKLIGAAEQFPANGYKRYSAIPNASITDGVLTSAAQTAWEAVAEFMDNIYEDALGAHWTQVLYRPTGALTNTIANAIVQPNVTSQNTRKIGRGA